MPTTDVIVSFRELDATVRSTTDGIYGLVKYPAKFIPQVVNYALDQALLTNSSRGSDLSVIDPFAGVGTVAVSAHLRNLKAELWDINPMMKHNQLAHGTVLNSTRPILRAVSDVGRRLRSVEQMKIEEKPSIDEENLNYLSSWYHEDVFSLIASFWAIYEDSDELERAVMFTSLVKVSNKWSYNDLQKQKLCRSVKKTVQVGEWLKTIKWEAKLVDELMAAMDNAALRYRRHRASANWVYDPDIYIAKAGSQTQGQEALPIGNSEIVVTSPPYLQAQEYIRASKLPLLWLGHSLSEIKDRSRLEIPYCDPNLDQKVSSPTLLEINKGYESKGDKGAIKVLESYFNNTIEALTRASMNARELYLFVGSAGLHGTSVPLDIIFAEHFVEELGWEHKVTLRDQIATKTLFSTAVNPETKRPDVRMGTEQLVVLTRQ